MRRKKKHKGRIIFKQEWLAELLIKLQKLYEYSEYQGVILTESPEYAKETPM